MSKTTAAPMTPMLRHFGKVFSYHDGGSVTANAFRAYEFKDAVLAQEQRVIELEAVVYDLAESAFIDNPQAMRPYLKERGL